MFLGGLGVGLVGGEFGVGEGVFEPGEKFAVEEAVEFLGVQGVQPGGEEAVEVAGLAVAVDPAEALREG